MGEVWKFTFIFNLLGQDKISNLPWNACEAKIYKLLIVRHLINNWIRKGSNSTFIQYKLFGPNYLFTSDRKLKTLKISFE